MKIAYFRYSIFNRITRWFPQHFNYLVFTKKYAVGLYNLLKYEALYYLAWPWRTLKYNYSYRNLTRKTRGGSHQRRSVIFLHYSYYHFYYLAQALRKRGWDAITVGLEDPNGPNSNYYHGVDLDLYSPDPAELHYRIKKLFKEAKKRFRLMHFAGDELLSFFPKNWDSDEPWDIIEWRRLGHKIAYTICGCSSGTAQSSVSKWSASNGGESVCDKCIWQLYPEVCNDVKNLAWGFKVDRYCDVIFAETLPALDYIATSKAIREPTTMCLDPNFWHPDMCVPDEFKIPRKEGELLVYHGLGNYESRAKNGRNIKGTSAVIDAIERLKCEGMHVRLVFVTQMKNTEVRFIQVQADVIVDQLNYGRYGATAREGMMLGKPTICYINQNEIKPENALSCMRELPLVSAKEKTIYQVLKDLLMDPVKRHEIGKASRNYALKWHSADACAERYEQIYDRLMGSS